MNFFGSKGSVFEQKSLDDRFSWLRDPQLGSANIFKDVVELLLIVMVFLVHVSYLSALLNQILAMSSWW